MSTVRVENKIHTEDWQDDAGAIMADIRALTRRRTLPQGCRVVLFELAGDRDLHVNVIHPHSTATPAGWAGPGETPGGFVHNRRFDYAESDRIARHIQEMVYAPADRAAAASRVQ